MNFGINGQPQTSYAILVNGEFQILSIDEITNNLVNIAAIHHEVHEGEFYTVSFLALVVANTASIEVLMRTGTTYPHMTFDTSCGGNAEVELIENPTVNAVGTALTEYNNKRYSTKLPLLSAFHTPTIVGGTVILEAILGGGTGGNSSGGILRTNSEFILKPSEDYVLRVTNRAGNNQPASIVINWYEEDTP